MARGSGLKKVDNVKGNDYFQNLCFLEKRIYRLVMNTEEEVLEFQEYLVYEGSQLNLSNDLLLQKILMRLPQVLALQADEALFLE